MSRTAGEILTLQIGNYANFVGTHWWNLQESTFVYDPRDTSVTREIDNDVLFREGITLDGEVTYTPRLVSYDLKCNLGCLKQDGELYDAVDVAGPCSWPEDSVSRYTVGSPDKNEFLQDLQTADEKSNKALAANVGQHVQKDSADLFRTKLYDLDNSVRVWSDYLRLHLHPKSVHTINEYNVQNEVESFNVYGYGQELYNKEKYTVEVEDKLHFFSEECDFLQGFHILADTSDGFGGFAAKMVNDLADDFPKQRMLTFGLMPAAFLRGTNEETLHRTVNNALAWASLCDNSFVMPVSLNDDPWGSSVVPLRLPWLSYQPQLHYHTSAVVACALDAATLAYRVPSNTRSLSMSSMVNMLTGNRRQMGNISVCMPFPIRNQEAFSSSLLRVAHFTDLQTSLLPNFKSADTLFSQSVVMRGVPQQESVEVVDRYLQDKYSHSANSAMCVQQPCIIQAPFPLLFDPCISESGHVIDDGAKRSADRSVQHCPVLAGFQCSTDAAKLLRHVRAKLLAVPYARLHRFSSAGLEQDDLTELHEKLEQLACAYFDEDMN